MRIRPLVTALPIVLLALSAAAAPLPRVASATLCADQLVLRLADPDQIVSLSPQAHDPTLSLLAEAAQAYPTHAPDAERYVASGVTLMLSDAWTGHKTATLLEGLGVSVVRLPLVNDAPGVEAMIRTAAVALGHPERGEALITETRNRLAAVAVRAAGHGHRALYLRPDGGTAGAGTFVDWIMTLNGLDNQATRYGLTGWSGVSGEQILLDPPDLILHSFFDRPVFSARSQRGRNPAYMPPVPVLTVPGATWVCGNWGLAVAAEVLSDALTKTLPPPPVSPRFTP